MHGKNVQPRAQRVFHQQMEQPFVPGLEREGHAARATLVVQLLEPAMQRLRVRATTIITPQHIAS